MRNVLSKEERTMKRVLITSTSAMAFHFFVPHIKALIDNGYEVEYACTPIDDFEQRLKEKLKGKYQINIHPVSLQRSPFSLSNVKGLKDITTLINAKQYDLIITNEPVMGVITRLAAREFRRAGGVVVYIAHGFHFFKGAPLVNWLLYYPIERWMSRYADTLVVINREDFARGKTFHFKRVHYIPGIGFDSSRFRNAVVDKDKKRTELNLERNDIVLLSVGELDPRKNHQVVIRALAQDKNSKLRYLIVGMGPLDTKLKALVEANGLSDQVRFLGYRRDIEALCKCADIFVHPSQREGLGIAALEGMAAGLPLITSWINGIRDYAEDGKTGYCCDPKDVDAFSKAIEMLAESPEKRERMGSYGSQVVQAFDIENVSKIFQRIIAQEMSFCKREG